VGTESNVDYLLPAVEDAISSPGKQMRAWSLDGTSIDREFFPKAAWAVWDLTSVLLLMWELSQRAGKMVFKILASGGLTYPADFMNTHAKDTHHTFM